MKPLREVIARVGRDVAQEVVVNVFAAAALASLAFVGLGGRMEDVYLRLGGVESPSSVVSVLAIDEEALYLWDPANPAPATTPRALLAVLVAFLQSAGAKVVVLDVLTDTPAPGDDALLAAVVAHGRVVAAERFTVGDAVPFAPASVLGHTVVPAYANLGQEETTLFSGELRVRAVPPVMSVARSRLSGAWPGNLVGGFADDEAPIPALSLAAAYLHAADKTGAQLASELAAVCGGVPLSCTGNAAALGLPASTRLLHESLPIYFRGAEGADGIATVPAARVLRLMGESALARSLGMELPVSVPTDLAGVIAGRVVLVGRTDAAAEDRFVTPFSFPAFQDADLAGVRVHAQVVDRLLAGRHLHRVDGPVAWASAAVLGALVLATARRAGASHLVGWLGALGLIGAGGAFAFRAFPGVVIDTGPAMATVAVAMIVVHLYARGAAE